MEQPVPDIVDAGTSCSRTAYEADAPQREQPSLVKSWERSLPIASWLEQVYWVDALRTCRLAGQRLLRQMVKLVSSACFRQICDLRCEDRPCGIFELLAVALSCEPFHVVGSKHSDWIRTVFAWPRLDSTAQTWVVPDPFDMDAGEPVLQGVASVGRVQVRDKHPVGFRTTLGVHGGRQVGLVERTDCRVDTAHLPVLQRLGSLPTCRRRFSCHNPVVSLD